jgi:hypothetical protein
MAPDLFPKDPEVFAQLHFALAPLRDVRRRRRVVKIAAAMAAHPGRSIPRLFAGRSYDFNAAYDLFKNPDATPEHLQNHHRCLTHDAMRASGRTVLLIQDTSTLSWSGKEPIEGLGPVGSGARGLQGFDLHTTMAVRWPIDEAGDGHRPPIEMLGLADQQFLIRPRRKGKRVRSGQMGQIWAHSAQRVGRSPEGTRWIDVADRGADIFDFLCQCRDTGHGFIVRAGQDRALLDCETGKDAGHLFETVKSARPLGTMDIDLRGRDGRPKRRATVSLSAVSVALRSPHSPKHARGSRPPLMCTAVGVIEKKPPRDAEPLEWIVLCDAPIATLAEARRAARMYATRWLIEEFHKCLKSGLRAEHLQLATADRLSAAIAIMSVVALRLLDLRERGRAVPDAPAPDSGLSDLHLRVLAHRTGRTLNTVLSVVMALGRLGGHPGRRGDGPPGWLTLWRGWQDLDALVQGVQIAQEMK